MNNIDNFFREVSCLYKEEKYSVRDNGAILRHPHEGKKQRPIDNQWTFGKINDRTGYMEIASVRVHRIVATAFHGEPPTKEHVVDHIDTNKQNNRQENLRWVTRLENILLNPITAKRIALACGSVEAFLSDPSKFRDKFQEKNFQWMRTVTIDEAQISLARLLAWAANDKRPSGGSLDKWIFARERSQIHFIEPEDLIIAKTPGAAQRDWRTPSEFPCCPQKIETDPIASYAEQLKAGSIFCQNDAYTSLVFKSAISSDRQSLYVISESTEKKTSIKPWALAKITYESSLFVHASLHNFFTKEGAEKQFILVQGLEWTGGDSIDDYC